MTMQIDVLMQREHLSRQQRIRLVQSESTRAYMLHRRRSIDGTSTSSSPAVDEVTAVGKAQLITSTGDTTMCCGNIQGRRCKPKDHSEHGRGRKKKQGIATPSSLLEWNIREETSRLARHHRRSEGRETNARRNEKEKRELVAEQHCLKAMLLVWRALEGVTEIAHLQTVKAERHYQYCAMHRVWINLVHNVTCSRAHRTEQVERRVISLKKRDAWRRWKHHHHGLVNASYMVRRERDTSFMSQYFSNWIEAWTIQARQSAAIERVATRSGQRASKSRFLRAWRGAVETSKKHTLLAEERFQMWQRVERWLTPADSL